MCMELQIIYIKIVMEIQLMELQQVAIAISQLEKMVNW